MPRRESRSEINSQPNRQGCPKSIHFHGFRRRLLRSTPNGLLYNCLTVRRSENFSSRPREPTPALHYARRIRVARWQLLRGPTPNATTEKVQAPDRQVAQVPRYVWHRPRLDHSRQPKSPSVPSPWTTTTTTTTTPDWADWKTRTASD